MLGGGEKREQTWLETPKSIPQREQQRLAAGGHVHLLREPYQRNLTRSESARRTAAAFIRKERYKLLPAFLLPALTRNTRAAPTPTATPQPLSSPARSRGLGDECRATLALATLHRRPPAPPSRVLGRTKPPCSRSVDCSHPKHTYKSDRHLRDPESCQERRAGRRDAPPLPLPTQSKDRGAPRRRVQPRGLGPAGAAAGPPAYLPRRGLPRSAGRRQP